MNAKKVKEINQNMAYQILNEFLCRNLWDPVVTNRMSDIQCSNRFYKALEGYFKIEKTLIYYNKNSALNLLEENKEIIPMMQEYNFHKYKEEHEI